MFWSSNGGWFGIGMLDQELENQGGGYTMVELLVGWEGRAEKRVYACHSTYLL